MEVLMSGDIYIKKRGKPIYKHKHSKDKYDYYTSFTPVRSLVQYLEEKERKSSTPSKGRRIVLKVLTTIFPDPARELREVLDQLEKEDFNESSKGATNFWVLSVEEDKLKLIEQNAFGKQKKKKYSSKDEMEKDFISLRDFFAQADYIGRHFIRTEPLSKENLNFTYPDDRITVLYATKDLMLVENEVMGQRLFEMIPPKYLRDGKYTFYGEKNLDYLDSPELYQAIFKQIYNNNQLRM